MSFWEAGRVENLSGLEIEPKKQEKQLLFKVGIHEALDGVQPFRPGSIRLSLP